jgi:hypothetical protein
MLQRYAFLTILIATTAGCIGHYRYESQGTVVTAEGQSTHALLYWYGDDGRLWYGKPYRQIDSGISMIVCGRPAKSFDGGGEDDPLVLLSRAGDQRIRRATDDSELVPITPPERLVPGKNCGEVSLAGSGVPSKALEPGSKPAISVLCDNPSKPLRYPAVGIYRFESINRTKVKDNIPPGDICTATPL